MNRKRNDRPLNAWNFPKHIGCGKLYVTITHDEDGLIDIFTSNASEGGCIANTKGLAIALSVALKSGTDPYDLAEALEKVTCNSVATKMRNTGIACTSCPKAIALSLREAADRFNISHGLKKGEVSESDELMDPFRETSPKVKEYISKKKEEMEDTSSYCPNCGKVLSKDGKCVTCECGYSVCNL